MRELIFSCTLIVTACPWMKDYFEGKFVTIGIGSQTQPGASALIFAIPAGSTALNFCRGLLRSRSFQQQRATLTWQPPKSTRCFCLVLWTHLGVPISSSRVG